MRLVRLIYFSRVAEACGVNDIGDILSEARKNNDVEGVTGVLCYDRYYFLQWLEGPREAVNRLYAGIVGDARHRDAEIIEYAEIDAREFSGWSMGVVSTREATKGILFKYCPTKQFDPFLLGGEAARSLIIELAREHQTHLAETVAQLEARRK